MTRICITILSYNGQDLLESCIQSLLHLETNSNLEYEIHVLDNDSKDDSWQILERLSKRNAALKIFKSDYNTGFAAGHNLLIKQAFKEFDYFLLFNQDASAVDGQLLENLFNESKFLKDQALIQPAILNAKGQVAGAGSMVTYFGLGVPTTKFYDKAKGDLFKVDVTQFAAVLIPKIILERAGLLSEIYFAYHEDLDYSQKARLYGFKNYSSKNSRILHDQQPGKFKAKKFGMYLAERNRYYYLFSHFSWPTLLSILPILLLQELSLIYFFYSNQNLSGKIRGYSELVKNWPQLMNFRKETRNIIVNSKFRNDFFKVHRGAFDASKLLEDPGISKFSKLAIHVLNFAFWVYRPIYSLSWRIRP